MSAAASPSPFFYSGPLMGSPASASASASARSGAWLPPIHNAASQTTSPAPYASPLPSFYPATPLPPLLAGGPFSSHAHLGGGGTFGSHAQLRTMLPLHPSLLPIDGGGLSSSDPYSSQIMNRRYNLLIRSAPTNSHSNSIRSSSGAHHRASRKQIGPRRIAQTVEAATAASELGHDSSHSGLHPQFGSSSKSELSRDRAQRRARRREEEALAAEQRHVAITARDRQREANRNRPSKMQGPSQAALHAAAAAPDNSSDQHSSGSAVASATSASASASPHVGARHRKQVLHFLTATNPPKHRFFAHLSRPPVLDAELARRICLEVGSDALDHLRILSAQACQFESLSDLMQALRQSAAFETEQRESAERKKRHPFPEQAILEGRGVGSAFDAPQTQSQALAAVAPPARSGVLDDRRGAAVAPLMSSGAFASEQERAIAAVSSLDRDRLVAYLTSSPLHPERGADTYLAPASDTDSEATPLVPTPVPSSCHLFADEGGPDSEGDGGGAGECEVTATPREIAQLIVENGGIERTLHTLIKMDAEIVAAAATAATAAAATAVLAVSSDAAAAASSTAVAAPAFTSSRGFHSFQALARALRAQAASREETRRVKEALRDYFARGAETWRRERAAAARNAHTNGSGGQSNGDSTGGKHKDAAAVAAASEPISLADQPTAARTPRRDVVVPAPACRLFLHLAQFPLITSADLDRLCLDSQTGPSDVLAHCRRMDDRGERLASFQELIERVRDLQRQTQGGSEGPQTTQRV